MKTSSLKLIHAVQQFQPIHEPRDRIWKFYYRHKNRWAMCHVQEYRKTFYFSGDHFDDFEIDDPKKEKTEDDSKNRRDYFYEDDIQKTAEHLIPKLHQLYQEVRKDPVSYHRNLNQKLSPDLRMGVIPRKFVHKLLPQDMRFDQELTKKEKENCIEMLRRHRYEALPKMTADLFFKYCKIAYLANSKSFPGGIDAHLSGKELYKQWADGRDGGLLSLPEDSAEAFEKWHSSDEHSGCHPWEIYRGGNSTHISLSV